jgi:hypothetical protein
LCEWEDLNNSPTKRQSTLKKGAYLALTPSLRLRMGQEQTVEFGEYHDWLRQMRNRSRYQS